jgi:uncharacterized membrane protein HdeD (DUF308 family)
MSVELAVKQRVVPWWLTFVEGVALIILGLLFLTNPAATAVAAVTVLGLYWLVAGILNIVGIFLNSHNWIWKLLVGVLGIIAGILILQHPLTGTVAAGAALVLWMGIIGLIMGIGEIIRGVTGEGLGAVIVGVVTIVLAALLLLHWQGVTFALPFALGVLALLGGVIALWHGWQARGIQKAMEAGTDELTNQYRAAQAKVEAAADKTAGAAKEAAADVAEAVDPDAR